MMARQQRAAEVSSGREWSLLCGGSCRLSPLRLLRCRCAEADPEQGWKDLHGSLSGQSQNESLLEKFLLQMTLKLFMQYPHAFCRYRYNYFIMLSCEV